MTTDTQLIVAPPGSSLPVFKIEGKALEHRDKALEVAALIGKVENAEQNAAAVNAMKALKAVTSAFEMARKKAKEPILEVGRQLDREVATAVVDVEKEHGRLSNLCSDFQLAERRRIAEEERKQREELERIERERQAEIARIERERQEAERLAREASPEHQAKLAAEAQETARLATRQADERAEQAKAIEARPILVTRSAGQVVKDDWEIAVTNPRELAWFNPDCVDISPRMGAIKAALNQGVNVKGIVSRRIVKAGVCASTSARDEILV